MTDNTLSITLIKQYFLSIHFLLDEVDSLYDPCGNLYPIINTSRSLKSRTTVLVTIIPLCSCPTGLVLTSN